MTAQALALNRIVIVQAIDVRHVEASLPDQHAHCIWRGIKSYIQDDVCFEFLYRSRKRTHQCWSRISWLQHLQRRWPMTPVVAAVLMRSGQNELAGPAMPRQIFRCPPQPGGRASQP